MNMKCIIGEKPSVARSIAAIVGATNKEDGFLYGNGYTVTWALGHLVGLAMPEDYGFAGFVRENLPIIPETFILKPRQIKDGKEYKPDSGALRQLKIIGQLFQKCDKIIVCTDAGREGELIFRYIYAYLNCKKPFERLWISSLTEKGIFSFSRLILCCQNGTETKSLFSRKRLHIIASVGVCTRPSEKTPRPAAMLNARLELSPTSQSASDLALAA
jgi:DNA topoisomerase IA